MPFKIGLVSVSFRQLSAQEIVNLCVRHQLEGIEWGGDVHLPAGEVAQAHSVGQMTREAGLEVVCYGSYYRCEENNLRFEQVLKSAVALQAPLIRVWAGNKSSQQMGVQEFCAVADNLRWICTLAQSYGIKIATEYHGGTLTDTRASCEALHRDVNHPNLLTLWQPLRRRPSQPEIRLSHARGSTGSGTTILRQVKVAVEF